MMDPTDLAAPFNYKESDYDADADLFANGCFGITSPSQPKITVKHEPPMEAETKTPLLNDGDVTNGVASVSLSTRSDMSTPSPKLTAQPEDKKGGKKEKGAKKERNKMAASKYRKRKKAYLEGLEGKIKIIEAERESQSRQIEDLKACNQLLYHQNVNLLEQVNFLRSLICMGGGAATSVGSSVASACGRVLKKQKVMTGLTMVVAVLTISVAVLYGGGLHTTMESTESLSDEQAQMLFTKRNPHSTSDNEARLNIRDASSLETPLISPTSIINDPPTLSAEFDTSDGSEVSAAPPHVENEKESKKSESNLRSKSHRRRKNLADSVSSILRREVGTQLEAMEEEKLAIIESRARFIQTYKIDSTLFNLTLEQLLLPDAKFCVKIGCTEEMRRRLKTVHPSKIPIRSPSSENNVTAEEE